MKRLAFLGFLSMVIGSLICGKVLAKDEPTTTSRTTIKGMAKAIGEVSSKPNPSIPNATLTVKEKDSEVTYYVCGWAGVILAMKANGKEAEVSGVIGEKDGKKTITGKSIDVTIEGVPFEKPNKPETGKKSGKKT